MNKSSDVLLVISTCPADHAQSLAETLVGERLAACVNIMPAVRSVYRWEGAVCADAESLLLIKTTRVGYAALESRISQLHPYDVPEILAVPVDAGLPAYLRWVEEAVPATPPTSDR